MSSTLSKEEREYAQHMATKRWLHSQPTEDIAEKDWPEPMEGDPLDNADDPMWDGEVVP